MLTRSLACAALLLSAAASAQQCGTYNGTLFKDGFGPPDASFVMEPEVTLSPEGTPMALTISAPADNAVLGTDTVQVYGSYAGPPAVGVAINGDPTVQTASQYIGMVTLEPGFNTITVTLTTLSGITQTLTRNVSYEPAQQPEIELQAESQGEHAPIKRGFTLKTKPGLGLTITRLQMDYDGDGNFELDTPNGATALRYEYTTPGVFTPVATVTLDDSDPMSPPLVRTSSRKMAIVPLPLTRATLCYVNYRMKARLTANDIPGALESLHEEIRQEWQEEFAQMDLPQVAPRLGFVVNGRLGIRIAELKVRQDTDRGPRVKSISFERAEDGVWRITSM